MTTRRQLFWSTTCRENKNPLPPHLSFPTCTSIQSQRGDPQADQWPGVEVKSCSVIGWMSTWGRRGGAGGRGLLFSRQLPRNRRAGAESSSNNPCTTLYTLFLYDLNPYGMQAAHAQNYWKGGEGETTFLQKCHGLCNKDNFSMMYLPPTHIVVGRFGCDSVMVTNRPSTCNESRLSDLGSWVG